MSGFPQDALLKDAQLGLLSYNYTMRFIGYDSIQNSLIHILSLSKSHSNVASIQKNRAINCTV